MLQCCAFSVELFDGKLYLTLGSSRYPFDTSPVKLNDIQPHQAKVDLPNNRTVRLSLDGQEKLYDQPSPQRSFQFGDNLLIGGHKEGVELPWKVLNRGSDLFYRGCLWGLRTNSDGVFDLADVARRAPRGMGLSSGCLTASLECEKSPCKHGTCRNLWNDYFCDCSQTSYHGRQCEKGEFATALLVVINLKTRKPRVTFIWCSQKITVLILDSTSFKSFLLCLVVDGCQQSCYN